MDALDDSVCGRIMGFMPTPRDAVRFAAVSKRMRRVKPSARFELMLVAADDFNALDWLRAHASRVVHVRIDCEGAELMHLLIANRLASEMPFSTRLDLHSPLFNDILTMLNRGGAAMTALLKRHVEARLGGATRNGVRELDREMLDKYGYDTDHDAYARASFAWECDNLIPAGECGQLVLETHLWQSADFPQCEFHLEVRRNSNNYIIHSSERVHGDENTTDWWQQAATLFHSVRRYELWPVEEEDDISESEDE